MTPHTYSYYALPLLKILMIFCMITVLVIFFSGCSAKGEEVFDTFLLVARNLIQASLCLFYPPHRRLTCLASADASPLYRSSPA